MLNKNRVEPKEILKKLRGNGFRITTARKSIIEILSLKHDAVTLTELKKHLETRNVRADRTTIYREILFLKKQGTICEIPIGGGKKGYKICEDGHHHHLICIRCNKVEEVVFKRGLSSQENEIAQKYNFKVLDHLLEFYGLCGSCQ